jgi:WD40 repeat protein
MIMVVAILVSQFFPSSRGLQRRSDDPNAPQATISSVPQERYEQFGTDSAVAAVTGPAGGVGASGHRRKSFKAISALTSLASDLDLISDWIFLGESVRLDREHRRNYQAGHDPESSPFLIPPLLLWLTLFSCILGMFMWLVVATDGRIIAPFMRRAGFDKISMGHMLFLCVMVEDIPQVILTFLIDEYFEEDDSLSTVVICNLMASLYDMLIKLAESYDERHDVVETGDWLKESLWAHKDTVTSVIAIPLPPSAQDVPSVQDMNINSSLRRFPERQTNARQSQLNSLQRRSTSVFDEALLPVAPMQIPRLRFITCSLDKTVRLWDTAASMVGHRRDKCIRTFRGHMHGVTCLAFLGSPQRHLNANISTIDDQDEEAEYISFFVSGCKNGYAKMWNLRGDCIRSYYLPKPKSPGNGVVCITALDEGSHFVCGYQDGTAILWGAWTGVCIGSYCGHAASITSICSMRDGVSFITGSKDSAIKIWSTACAMEALQKTETASSFELESRRSSMNDQAYHEEFVCEKVFQNRLPSPVLAIAYVEGAKIICSGSEDGFARLWSVERGVCMRVFAGHGGPVCSIAILDEVTILTGSADTNIMAWDALSGMCLRTYSDHSSAVTSITVADDNKTFMSASADQTVKIWVVTSVLPLTPSQLVVDTTAGLNVEDGLCHS